jgi:hypothetical protein
MAKYNPRATELDAFPIQNNDGLLIGFDVLIDDEGTSIQFDVEHFNKLFTKAQVPTIDFGELLKRIDGGAAVARQSSVPDAEGNYPAEYIVFITPTKTFAKIYLDNTKPAGDWIPTQEEMYATNWFVLYETIEFRNEPPLTEEIEDAVIINDTSSDAEHHSV